MRTVIANGAVVAWAILLIYAPAFTWALVRRPTPAVFAIGGLGSAIAISIVGYVAGELGVGALNAMRALAAVLALLLVFVLVRITTLLIRRRPLVRSVLREWVVVPVCAFVGFWALLPALIALRGQHLTFGLTSLGNSDLPNYVLLAQNLASAGFRDTHHIANINIGHSITAGTPIGPVALLVFIAAATGLSMVQVAMATMAVAVCMLSVGLWALGSVIWPERRMALAAAVAVSALAGLALYNYGQYFLGAELGSAAIATTAAGVIGVARSMSAEAIASVAFGGAFGVYGYSPLGIPVLLIVPFAAAAAALLFGRRHLADIGKSIALTLVGELGALALAALALSDAIALARLQSNDQAGWYLPVISGASATIWPQGISHHQSHAFIIGTWLVIGVIVVCGLLAAWRQREQTSVYLAGLIFLAAIVIALAFAHLYGATRYQTWKIESFLLPIAGVSVLPAYGVVTTRLRPLFGRTVLALAAAVALLGPWLLWDQYISKPNPALITDATLAGLNRSPAMKNLAVVNIRLPYPVTSMSAGAILDNTVIVFTQASYYAELTATNTCTLTVRSLLSPGETSFTDLGGGYVLLNRPSACARK